jgi:hypothetical protein
MDYEAVGFMWFRTGIGVGTFGSPVYGSVNFKHNLILRVVLYVGESWSLALGEEDGSA